VFSDWRSLGAGSDSADRGGARCSAGIEFEASQVRHGARYRSSMGRLRLGLASRPRPLEPVARRMGSAALRTQSRWRRLGRSLWRLVTRSVSELERLAGPLLERRPLR
jgi:hypothetical protein